MGRLSEKARKRLLEIARESIKGFLLEGRIPSFEEEDPELQEKKGAFVTLKTRDGGLRGCIGFTSAMGRPLYKVISEAAVAAAFDDPRFPPVSREELDRIKLEISVLSEMERVKDVGDIEVGKHGLYIRKKGRSGLLLPQVATEDGWDREEVLRHVCLKAGLSPDDWKEGAELFIFSAEVFGEEEGI